MLQVFFIYFYQLYELQFPKFASKFTFVNLSNSGVVMKPVVSDFLFTISIGFALRADLVDY